MVLVLLCVPCCSCMVAYSEAPEWRHVRARARTQQARLRACHAEETEIVSVEEMEKRG